MSHDLAEFSWHTGGRITPLAEGEPRPVLYRDLGPVGTLLLLEGRLMRLAGPTSPITYLRTAQYTEPFKDHEHFGRIALLPWATAPRWHAGTPEIFVTEAETRFDAASMELVPDDRDLANLDAQARAMNDMNELHEALGAQAHQQWKAETLSRLRSFAAELTAMEQKMSPLRAAYQSSRQDERSRARERMAQLGISEEDLCSAWHHIPRARRDDLANLSERGPLWP